MDIFYWLRMTQGYHLDHSLSQRLLKHFFDNILLEHVGHFRDSPESIFLFPFFFDYGLWLGSWTRACNFFLGCKFVCGLSLYLELVTNSGKIYQCHVQRNNYLRLIFQNFLVLGFDTFLVISTFLRREMLIRFYLILSVNTWPNIHFYCAIYFSWQTSFIHLLWSYRPSSSTWWTAESLTSLAFRE